MPLKAGEKRELITSYGNYLGFALKSRKYGFKSVLSIGIETLKVAAGILDTTGRVADARSEIMTASAAYLVPEKCGSRIKI